MNSAVKTTTGSKTVQAGPSFENSHNAQILAARTKSRKYTGNVKYTGITRVIPFNLFNLKKIV